jgi:transposase
MKDKVQKNNIDNQKFMLDNASIHRSKVVDENIKNNCIYNVPYYSKFNPIEMFFNTLKKYLKSFYIKSISNLRNHINEFIKNVKSETLNNYFDKSFSFLK